ncbi:hypothetical protein EJ06DRAFT_107007 [Trichodelitschia bisporula]|uniref:Uncharacterized protein n=1 Tax=Trichodelitschia bisporula TaxID=703511 RepID=A0A6G1HQS1_9PEZI|nr:hypothetical protein EJ06DRAFT_107007 [Trichodelitschia bisporula]
MKSRVVFGVLLSAAAVGGSPLPGGRGRKSIDHESERLHSNIRSYQRSPRLAMGYWTSLLSFTEGASTSNMRAQWTL